MGHRRHRRWDLDGAHQPPLGCRDRSSLCAIEFYIKPLATREIHLHPTVKSTAVVESPGGISPPGAPRTVHDPFESHGSRCSAVAIERLCLVHRLLPFPVGQWPGRTTQPLRSSPLQGLRRYYGLLRPCAPLRYSRPRGWSRLRLVPSRHRRDEAQVLTFHTKAWSSFAPPTCRMPLGQYQGIPRADPGGRVTPRF